MAWYLNHYECDRCGRRWDDEWSCMCDDECPHCDARNMSPSDSDDLTEVVAERGRAFAVMRSPDTAEHKPDYQEIARFSTAELAAKYIAAG